MTADGVRPVPHGDLQAGAPPALTVLSSMATRRLLAELIADFGTRTGILATLTAVGGVEAAARVRAGEAWDVVVLAAPALAALGSDGHLAAGSRVDLARSGIVAAIPEGGRPYPLATEDDVRAAMLDARTLAYSTGPSGDHLKRLWHRWGIADALGPRAIQAPPGIPVAALLARREADLGFQQHSELIGAAGVTILGPLPAAIQCVTTFAASLSTTTTRDADAAALLRFLAAPDTSAAKRRLGLEPPGQAPA